MLAHMAIAIIPAQGGSKGIPGKYLRLLSGKPLLAWSIKHAKQTPQTSRVFVSTDSAEVAAVSREWGAEVVPRYPELLKTVAANRPTVGEKFWKS
jgi:CMP-N-acetylneuraminic acid synthetase